MNAIENCCNAPPNGICAGVRSDYGLVAADPTCKTGVALAILDEVLAALTLIEQLIDLGLFFDFSSKQLCHGETALKNAVASFSEGIPFTAFVYGVTKAHKDLGCPFDNAVTGTVSDICSPLFDAIRVLQEF